MKKIILQTLTTLMLIMLSDSLLAAVDLKVTANPDPVLKGGRLEYTLTVTNTNNTAIDNVVVKDLFSNSVAVNYQLLPDGGTCPEGGNGICYAGERIHWTLGTLAAHTSRTVRFEAAVASNAVAGTVIGNLAELTYTGGNLSVSTDVTVAAAAELDLGITEDRDPVVPGEDVTYTVTYGNRSTNILGVTLRAPLPAGTAFVSATAGGSVVNGAVEWNLSTVLANSSGERRFTVTVSGAAAVGDVVLAEAQLVETSSALTLVRAREVTELVSATPVELYVTANPDPVLKGARLEYTLTVTNTSNTSVTGVVVEDLFSDVVGVSYTLLPDSGTCPQGGNGLCYAGERIQWTIGTLAARESRTVRFEADVTTSSAVPTGTLVRNLATVSSSGGRATARTAVPIAAATGLDLAVFDDLDPVLTGESITYTIAMGNRSTTNLTNLILNAPLPAGTTFVSATAGGVLDSHGVVTWNIKDRLLAGAVDIRRFTVTVNNTATSGDVIHAGAEIISATSGAPLVEAETVTGVATAAPVRLVTSMIPSTTVTRGLDYSITVTNTTSSQVTGVVIQDLFPQYTTVANAGIGQSGVCLGGTCTAGERISWTVGNLAAQSSQVVTYQALYAINLTNGTALRNHATVSYDVGYASSDLETTIGTIIDVDRDGLPDAWELGIFGNTNATTFGDGDQDGLSNIREYDNDTNPLDSDTDNDGMSDGFEVTYLLDPLNPSDASLDSDGDGLSNVDEYTHQTNPRNSDSDGDGMPDGFEVSNNLDPLNAADALLDADGDGYSNIAEYRAGTDPSDPNSRPKPNAMPWLPLLLQ